MSCPIPFRFLPTLCVRGGKGWCLQCCQGRHPGRWPCGHECLRRFRKVSVARFLKLLVTSCPSDLPSLPFVDLFFIWFCYSWGWPKTWCSLWQPFLGSNSTRHKRDTLILFGSCHDTSPLGSIFLGDMCFSGCLADSVLLRRHVINWPLFWGMSIVTGLLLDVAVASSMNATLRGAWPGWEHRKPFFFRKSIGEASGSWDLLRLSETFWDLLECITDASHISVVQELKAPSVLAPLDSVDMASWLKHLCTTVLRGSKDSEGTQPKDWING